MYPRLKLKLKRHTDGEKDEDDLVSENASGETWKQETRKEGTARILRRFRNWITVGLSSHSYWPGGRE